MASLSFSLGSVATAYSEKVMGRRSLLIVPLPSPRLPGSSSDERLMSSECEPVRTIVLPFSSLLSASSLMDLSHPLIDDTSSISRTHRPSEYLPANSP